MASELRDLCLAHFNEPVIVGDIIARCVGYAEDADDCYLIVRPIRGNEFWQTGVGGYVFLDRLKGQGEVISHKGEKWDDLFRLDRLLALNGAPKAKEFKEVRHERA